MVALPACDVCDYVIVRLDEDERHLNVLKLHKLLYYCQAWSLAFGEGRLIDAGFQAWIHGPVCREIYDRYVGTKSLYSSVTTNDISEDFIHERIPSVQRATVRAVLEKYSPLTGDQLEQMTHAELPWKEARHGVPNDARSDRLISERTMKEFYAERLKKAKKAKG